MKLKKIVMLGAFVSLKAHSASIKIEGYRNQSGNVCLSIFDQKEFFPDNPEGAVFSDCIAVTDIVSVNLDTNTEYAVAIFHDENSNGSMDKIGPLGIPKEGYGFSQNPGFKPGLPSFEEVKVKVKADSDIINIKLRYLL